MAEDTKHPSFKIPTNRNIKIWRYMDLSKFIATVQHNGIFFPRATLLGDPFESTMPEANVNAFKLGLEARKSNPEINFFQNLSDEQAMNMLTGMAHHFGSEQAKQMMISSWHMNEFESAAMWRLYSQVSESICIQSTYTKLREQLPETAYIGTVNYIDYATQPISIGNGFNFVMHKRISFEHERELRAVIWQHENAPLHANASVNSDGIWIGLDLAALLEQVLISPNSPHWFAEVVKGIVDRYGLNVPVHQSSLARSPIK